MSVPGMAQNVVESPALQCMIYALQDPTTWEIRYVGKTGVGLRRPQERHAAHCGHWLAKLKRMGCRPSIRVLSAFASGTSDVILNSAERYWISEFRRRGAPLTNLTDGGEGSLNMHPDVRAKIAAANLGKVASSRTRTRMSAAHLGHPVTPEVRTRISKGNTGKRFSAISRGRMTTAQLNRYHGSNTSLVNAPSPRKNRSGNTKLTDEQVKHILVLLEEGNMSQRQIAKMYAVTKSTIWAIGRGKRHYS